MPIFYFECRLRDHATYSLDHSVLFVFFHCQFLYHAECFRIDRILRLQSALDNNNFDLVQNSYNGRYSLYGVHLEKT